MDLNYKLLQDSLNKLHGELGVPYTLIMHKSSVYNVQRIIKGSIKPQLSTWWKLHKAFPVDVPQPSYTDGTTVSVHPLSGSGSKSPDSPGSPVRQRTYQVNIDTLTIQEMYYLELLKEVDEDGTLLKKHTMELMEKAMKKSTEPYSDK